MQKIETSKTKNDEIFKIAIFLFQGNSEVFKKISRKEKLKLLNLKLANLKTYKRLKSFNFVKNCEN